MSTSVDLTPFGFTGTESIVYGALLRSGPATGYVVARAARLARANVYAALSGLVARGAATSVPGRPTRYRPVDPQTLITQLAAEQAAALDRLDQSLRRLATAPVEAVHQVSGARPLAQVVLQLVARAERSVQGTVAAELYRNTAPAWRRAAGRATLRVWAAGAADDPDGLLAGAAPLETGTTLVIDDAVAIVAGGAGDAVRGLWSDHPLVVALARRALAGVA